jgi:hypothetical protein
MDDVRTPSTMWSTKPRVDSATPPAPRPCNTPASWGRPHCAASGHRWNRSGGRISGRAAALFPRFLVFLDGYHVWNTQAATPRWHEWSELFGGFGRSCFCLSGLCPNHRPNKDRWRGGPCSASREPGRPPLLAPQVTPPLDMVKVKPCLDTLETKEYILISLFHNFWRDHSSNLSDIYEDYGTNEVVVTKRS